MKPKIAIYLAGSIKKGHEKSEESFWSEKEISLLKKSLNDYEVSFLNPGFRTDAMADSFSVFGRDMLQVFCSNFVFVDARDRRGLGVGAEMMWAKLNKIPLIIWAPKNSHYHKEMTSVLGVQVENFIHPFVYSLADAIVETLEEGAGWIHSFQNNASVEIKGVEHIEKAMNHYMAEQLNNDIPMQELINSNEELKNKVHRLNHLAQV